MRYIRKHAEPEPVVRWRRDSPHATFADLMSPQKDIARQSLCSEQGHLCAYCQQRISPDDQKMKIEHWVAQSADPARDLDWTNLLGACPGAADPAPPEAKAKAQTAGGGKPLDTHCDTARGNRPLHVDPTTGPQIEDLFRYFRNGEIESDDDGARADIKTLNLNHWRLRQNRKKFIARLSQEIGKSGPWPMQDLKRQLRTWTTPGADGKLPEFAGVASYHLRRWIRRREGQA